MAKDKSPVKQNTGRQVGFGAEWRGKLTKPKPLLYLVLFDSHLIEISPYSPVSRLLGTPKAQGHQSGTTHASFSPSSYLALTNRLNQSIQSSSLLKLLASLWRYLALLEVSVRCITTHTDSDSDDEMKNSW